MVSRISIGTDNIYQDTKLSPWSHSKVSQVSLESRLRRYSADPTTLLYWCRWRLVWNHSVKKNGMQTTGTAFKIVFIAGVANITACCKSWQTEGTLLCSRFPANNLFQVFLHTSTISTSKHMEFEKCHRLFYTDDSTQSMIAQKCAQKRNLTFL